MTARVIDIADYRERKQAATRRAEGANSGLLTFWPMFCAFGWFLVPVMMPIAAGAPVRV